MNNKLVSVVMCTYNGEKYLKEQLESILHQTYKNLEIIIVDDCSTDTTISIIKQYMKIDDRISFFQNQDNLGFLKNFEKALPLSNGSYIALADQDDIWKENKIEIFLKNIQNNMLIYSDAIIIDKDSKVVGTQLIQPTNLLCAGKCNKIFFLNNVVSGNTLMFNKELLPYLLPFPKNITYHDSWIAYVASTYGSITFTSESLTYYRRYTEQVTHKSKKQHKSFFSKMKYKRQRNIDNALLREKELLALRQLTISQNDDTIELLNELINHFHNYKVIFFNFKLYLLLRKYSNEIFAIIPYKKRLKKTRRYAIGLRLKELSLFSL